MTEVPVPHRDREASHAPGRVVTIPDPPPPGDGGPRCVTVRILRAPVQLWDRASEHTAELMREFALLQIGENSGRATRKVPADLLQLVADLRARYAGISVRQERELATVVDAGERTHDFSYEVPPDIGPACRRLMELLDEADEFCAEGVELITLVAPEDQRRFRHWYLQEFIRQTGGEDPQPWSGPVD